MPLAVLVLVASVFGGSIIAIISWPKLIKAHLTVKKLLKEIDVLKKKMDASTKERCRQDEKKMKLHDHHA